MDAEITLTLVDRQMLQPAMWLLTLTAPAGQTSTAPQPGQFYLLDCLPAGQVYLRRAIWPTFSAGLWQILLTAGQLTDAGLSWLAGQPVGMTVQVSGPFGRGFQRPAQTKNMLLLAGGGPAWPLVQLAHELVAGGANVVVAQEGARQADLYPRHLWPAAAELYFATADGRAGRRGSVWTEWPRLSTWAEAVMAIGPLPFYRQLAGRWAALTPARPVVAGQVLLWFAPLHICGVGICGLCYWPTTAGLRPTCQAGPVFPLAEVEWPND